MGAWSHPSGSREAPWESQSWDPPRQLPQGPPERGAGHAALLELRCRQSAQGLREPDLGQLCSLLEPAPPSLKWGVRPSDLRLCSPQTPVVRSHVPAGHVSQSTTVEPWAEGCPEVPHSGLAPPRGRPHPCTPHHVRLGGQVGAA